MGSQQMPIGRLTKLGSPVNARPPKFSSEPPVSFSSPPVGVNVVFLHDIGQSCDTTWHNSPDELWLLNYLPANVLANLEIFFYDYQPLAIGLEDTSENSLQTLEQIVSVENLEQHAKVFRQQMISKWTRDEKQTPIFFIAHGFGGLILEQALLDLENEDLESDGHSFLVHPQGIVLFGTPHFRAGLAEWALLSAQKLGIPSKATVQRQDWSNCKQDIDEIARMQRRFCDSYKNRHPLSYAEGVDIICCYGKRVAGVVSNVKPIFFLLFPGAADYTLKGSIKSRLDRSTKSGLKASTESGPRITPEWAVLPGFRTAVIPADHFFMTSIYSAETETIKDMLSRWIHDLNQKTLIHRFQHMADSKFFQEYWKNLTLESAWRPKQLAPAKRLWRGENPYQLIPSDDLDIEKHFDVWDTLLTWRKQGPTGRLRSVPEVRGKEYKVETLSLAFSELERSSYRPLRWQLEVLEEWGRHVRMKLAEMGEGTTEKEHFAFSSLTAYKQDLTPNLYNSYIEVARKSSKVLKKIDVVVEILVVRRIPNVWEWDSEDSRISKFPVAVNGESSPSPGGELEYVFAYKVEELAMNGNIEKSVTSQE